MSNSALYNDFFDNTTTNRAGTAPQLNASTSLFNSKIKESKVTDSESASIKPNLSAYFSQPWEATNRPSTSSVATRGQTLPELNRLLKVTKARHGVISSNYNGSFADDNGPHKHSPLSPYAQPLPSSSSSRNRHSSRGGSTNVSHLYESAARLDSAKPKPKPKPFSSFTTTTSPYYSENRNPLRHGTSQRNVIDESNVSYSISNRMRLSTVTAIYGSSSKPKNAKKHKPKMPGRQSTATSPPFEIVRANQSEDNIKVYAIAEENERDADDNEPLVNFSQQSSNKQRVSNFRNDRSDPLINISRSGTYMEDDDCEVAEDNSASQYSLEDGGAVDVSARYKHQSKSHHKLIVNEELEESQHWTEILASASALTENKPSSLNKTQFRTDDVDIDDEPEELSMYLSNEAKGLEVHGRPPTRKIYLNEDRFSPTEESLDFVEEDEEETEMPKDTRPPTRKVYLTSSEPDNSSDAPSSPEDRPPSRQKSAFPFHLSEQQHLFRRNSVGDASQARPGSARVQQTFVSTTQSKSILNQAATYFASQYDKPDPNTNKDPSNSFSNDGNNCSNSHKGRNLYVETARASSEQMNPSITSVRGQLSGSDAHFDDINQRPPSRQKINAQYLDGSSNSAVKSNCSTPKFKKSSVHLTRTNSQSSLMKENSQSKLSTDNGSASNSSTPKASNSANTGRTRQAASTNRVNAAQSQPQLFLTSNTAPALPGATLTMGKSEDYSQYRSATSIGTSASSGLYGFTPVRGDDTERGYVDDENDYDIDSYSDVASGSNTGKATFKIIINNCEDDSGSDHKTAADSARRNSSINKYIGVSDSPRSSKLSSKFQQNSEHVPLHSSQNNLWINSTRDERQDESNNNFPTIGKNNSAQPLTASTKSSLSNDLNRLKNITRHNSTFSAESHATAISEGNDISSSYDEDQDLTNELQDGSNILETSLDATFLGLFSM